MKLNFGFSKCSSFINSWKPVIGYETEQKRNDFDLNESELAVVKDSSIPAGSKWEQYRDYTFIRLFDVDLKGKTLYVLSVAKVKQDNETERFYPKTYINVFDNDGMNLLKQMGAENLVKLCKNFTDLETDIVKLCKNSTDLETNIDITDFKKKKFYTYTYSTNEKHQNKQEEWHYLELFFIKNSLKQWNINGNINKQKVVSVATLCTMQDDFTKFDKIGILDPEKLSLKGTIPSYATIEIDNKNSGKSLKVKVVSQGQVLRKRYLNKKNLSYFLLALAFVGGVFFGVHLLSRFFFLPIHHSF